MAKTTLAIITNLDQGPQQIVRTCKIIQNTNTHEIIVKHFVDGYHVQQFDVVERYFTRTESKQLANDLKEYSYQFVNDLLWRN